MSSPVYSSFTKLLWNSVRYDFHPASMIARRDEHTDTNGLRGTLERSVERNLPGIYRVNGQLKLFPTATEMTTILPIVFGTAVSVITYALAESATGYTVVVARDNGTDGKVHTYAAVKAAKSRWHFGGHSQAFGVDIDLVGTTESEGAAGSFGATTLNVATKPWMFQQMTMTVDGTAVTPRSVEFTVDHVFDADRFFNSQTLSTAANWTDRHITMELSIPYGAFTAIYTSSLVNTGVPVVITLTNGVYILTFTFVSVAFRKEGTEINDRGELFLKLSGTAFKSSTTLSLVTTLAVS